jgi:hypothetical protein
MFRYLFPVLFLFSCGGLKGYRKESCRVSEVIELCGIEGGYVYCTECGRDVTMYGIKRYEVGDTINFYYKNIKY